jgi:cephalosporin hydroxylase
MSQKTLQQLYAEHQGKVSDKWSSYLTNYESLLNEYRHKPIRLFEIGIQNGGSLEIWSTYFSNSTVLIGCDINPDCAQLVYDNPCIKLIVGDANAPHTYEQIIQQSAQFDIVIDDGSHTSSDIIKSFCLFFTHVVEGGIYIIEDIHCSYWDSHEGGIFNPYSSISFFKHLVDVVNHEFWGANKAAPDILSGFFAEYGCNIEATVLSQIHSVEFINSICVIRKAAESSNKLGFRTIAGGLELVVPGHQELHGKMYDTIEPMRCMSQQLWNKELEITTHHIYELKHALANCQDELMKIKQFLAESDKEILQLQNDKEQYLLSTSWRITKPMRKISSVAKGVVQHIRAFSPAK